METRVVGARRAGCVTTPRVTYLSGLAPRRCPVLATGGLPQRAREGESQLGEGDGAATGGEPITQPEQTRPSDRQWTGLGTLGRLRQVEGVDIVVVDSPPRLDSVGLRTVAAAADYVVLPTPPAPLDMAALIATIRTVIAPLGVRYRVLLTRVDPRALNEAMEALGTLAEAEVPAFHAIVRSYKAHERASLMGVAALAHRGPFAKEAAGDYKRVADEVLRDW